jgi:hypothetical protein
MSPTSPTTLHFHRIFCCTFNLFLCCFQEGNISLPLPLGTDTDTLLHTQCSENGSTIRHSVLGTEALSDKLFSGNRCILDMLCSGTRCALRHVVLWEQMHLRHVVFWEQINFQTRSVLETCTSRHVVFWEHALSSTLCSGNMHFQARSVLGTDALSGTLCSVINPTHSKLRQAIISLKLILNLSASESCTVRRATDELTALHFIYPTPRCFVPEINCGIP